VSLILIASLTACGSHKAPNISTITPHQPKVIPQETPKPMPVKPADGMQKIKTLLLQGQQEGQLTSAIQGLQQLANHAPSPIKEEAAFRRVQLLLQHQQAHADIEAQYVLLTYPNHALVANTHLWIAQWWQVQEPIIQPDREAAQIFTRPDSIYANHVLDALSAALRTPNVSDDVIQRSVALSNQVITRASVEHSMPWYFAAAHADVTHRDYWLQLATQDLSVNALQMWQQQHVISPEHDAEVYLQVARQAMMSGDMNGLQQLLAMLQIQAPDLALTTKISTWLYGAVQPMHLGVMLPLTGRYARFGQQALNGIRLAAQTAGHHITLSIQDTAKVEIEAAYQALQVAGVDAILGPLLSKNTEILTPLLNPNIPVMALSMNQDIANLSPALFIHNLSPETQGKFMASYAFSQGLRRMAVIQSSNRNSEREAMSFISSFASLGGDIADEISLDESKGIDHRSMLQDLRENSDDKALLQQLIEQRALFIAEQRLDIHLPPNLDGLYLAINGKQVSELAGQLAYVDIRKVPLLGSSRWMDGHILDDRGRNLSTARFIQDTPNPNNSELRNHFHEVWGQGEPSKLLAIAYDSTQIISLLGGRLGLKGDDMIQALHTAEGFPSETGHVHFNAQGMGEKTFSLYRIQQHAIVPAQ